MQPTDTCTGFLTALVGEHVALIRDRLPKVVGTLVHVTPTDDDADPVLVIETDPASVERRRIRLSDVARVKVHFTATDPDRPRASRSAR